MRGFLLQSCLVHRSSVSLCRCWMSGHKKPLGGSGSPRGQCDVMAEESLSEAVGHACLECHIDVLVEVDTTVGDGIDLAVASDLVRHGHLDADFA